LRRADLTGSKVLALPNLKGPVNGMNLQGDNLTKTDLGATSLADVESLTGA
jgi:hypothetical protein